jgi:hypothetical protein
MGNLREKRLQRAGFGRPYAGARVSDEQRLNWGGAASPAPAQSDTGRVLWGQQRTGIQFRADENAGVPTPFRRAALLRLEFTKYKNLTLMDTAQTNDGFSMLWWLHTKATIRSQTLRDALQTFLADPRCADLVQMMQARDAKKASKGRA